MEIAVSVPLLVQNPLSLRSAILMVIATHQKKNPYVVKRKKIFKRNVFLVSFVENFV